MHDYQKAILVFSQVQEKFADHRPAYAEAVYRSGEALYAFREYLSARTKFRLVADHGKSLNFAPMHRRQLHVSSTSRCAWMTRRSKNRRRRAESESRAFRFPTSDRPSLYAKGKALFFKGDLDTAKATFASITSGPFYHQSRFCSRRE